MSPEGTSASSRQMSAVDPLIVTPQSDVRTELSLLRAQVERMESTILAGAQQAVPPAQGVDDRDTPPPYLPL